MLRLMRITRTFLTVALLSVFLAGSVPVMTLASGPMCTLACCAGRPPHAAGSCMNGSCHANLSRGKSGHVHHQPVIYETEQLCGMQHRAARFAKLRVTSIVSAGQESGRSGGNQNSVTASTLGKPCQPDCGSCAPGSANSNRKRDAATLAFATQPRSLNGARRAVVDGNLTRNFDSLCSQCSPRGPPLSCS